MKLLTLLFTLLFMLTLAQAARLEMRAEVRAGEPIIEAGPGWTKIIDLAGRARAIRIEAGPGFGLIELGGPNPDGATVTATGIRFEPMHCRSVLIRHAGRISKVSFE